MCSVMYKNLLIFFIYAQRSCRSFIWIFALYVLTAFILISKDNSFMLSVVVMFYWAGTGRQNVWPVVILEGYPIQSFLSSAAIRTAPTSLGIDMAGTLFLVVLVATLPCVHGAAGAQRQDGLQYSALYLLQKNKGQLQVTEWGVNNNLD